MGPGDVVANRFEIEALAGTGGMGTVYRARDLAAGELVALKMLASLGEQDAARFAREAAVLAELSHPGIVRYVAHGFTAQHQQYIAMEWLDGETLHDRLQRGRLGIADALAMARAVAAAIAAAHQRGVVHRDLKPMNLFVPAGCTLDHIKVLDFGIARRVAHAGLLTNTGTVLGTPGYMAPEQVRGDPAIDARTDVFALGCVVYRALTGSSAFPGEQALAVLAKILLEDVAPPSALEPTIPPALDAIVLRMLAKDPRDRPADGHAVLDELARLGAPQTLASDPATPRELGTAPTLTARSAARAITKQELRLVSIVLTGPTAADARIAATAAAFGGRVERFGDGANLVIFAHADVATDHAIRAARCALGLQELIPLAPLVITSGKYAERVTGSVIDRAVAAVREIASGQILVDPSTALLLGERFDLVQRGQRQFLRGARDDHPQEPVRTLLGRATPIVGRDRELATLDALWTECVDDRVARAVLVTAPPGGGKSRVRQELVRRVLQRDAGAELIVGRGDSLRAGSPFAMIADAIRRAAGVREGDALADQRATLHAAVSRHVPAAAVDRVTHLLGEIAGVAFPSDASEALRAARADPIARGDAMRTAWVDWLAGECAAHPVLLVLEDLHWGDRSTIDLVDAALRELAQAPLLVLALARPEIAERFPRLWECRDLQEIRLPQLTKKASERLVRDHLGSEVAAAAVDQIVERSAGNAFFLEELIRAVAEGHGDRLPDSILSMLQLRLDALTPGERRVLRAASVFGEVFWKGGVAALVDDDPGDVLARLTQRELVAVAPDSQLPGEIEYAFRHDLVREAAFQMTSDADRELAHRVAGEWLVAHGYGDAIALAGHFERGGEPARAAEQYARAAAQALAGNDSAAALAHAERGVACAPTGEVAAALRIAIAEAHNWRGEHAAAVGHGERARADCERGSRLWFRATDEVFYGAGRSGNIGLAVQMVHAMTTTVAAPDVAIQQVRSVARAAIVMLRFGPPGSGMALVDRTEELVGRLAIDAGTEQRLHELRAMAARARGDARRCLAEQEAGQRACETTHNLRELAFNYLSGANCHTELGLPAIALELGHRGIQVAERVGATTVSPLLWFAKGLAALDLGRLDDAHAFATRAAELAHGSDSASEGLARSVLGRVGLARGELDAAERELVISLDCLQRFSQYRSIVLASHAQLALARGDVAAARRAAADAMSTLRPDDGFEQGEALVRLAELETLEAAGDPGLAAATHLAIQRLESRAAGIEEPWRSTFLAKPEHAATLRRIIAV